MSDTNERIATVALVLMIQLVGCGVSALLAPVGEKTSYVVTVWLFLIAWDVAENNWMLRASRKEVKP